MSTKTVNLSLDEELLKIIDDAAKARYCTRSDYIREAVLLRIRRAKVIKNGQA